MKYLVSAAIASLAMVAAANAAPMTLGGVSFDTDNAATDVIWAQGGVFAGNLSSRREACLDPTDKTSTVGATGVNCRADEAAGFNLDDPSVATKDKYVELDENNDVLKKPDVIAAFFNGPLINQDGDDLLIFEAANQSDNPSVSLLLGGVEIIGTVLAVVEIDGKKYTISGFDFSDSPLNIALGAVIGEPIFIQTFEQVGSSDIAAIVGVNIGVVPLPAAAPFFFAGLAGLGFMRRKKKA